MRIKIKHHNTEITIDEVKTETSIRYHVDDIKKILDKAVEAINSLRGNKS